MLPILRSRVAPTFASATRCFSSGTSARQHYKDVTADQFEEHVMQAPAGKISLLDFKATWCGPCKFLTPLLEKVVPESSDVDLVTIDVDEQPELAAQFGIRAMPTVIAMRNGDQIGAFKGALPEGQLRKFLEDLPK